MLIKQDLKESRTLLNIHPKQKPMQVRSLNLYHLRVLIFNQLKLYHPQYSQIPQPREKVALEDTFCETTVSTAQAPKL